MVAVELIGMDRQSSRLGGFDEGKKTKVGGTLGRKKRLSQKRMEEEQKKKRVESCKLVNKQITVAQYKEAKPTKEE